MTLSEQKLALADLAALDAQSVETLKMRHLDYQIVTRYAEGMGFWRQGQAAPSVELDGPAEAQAAGYCVANRMRYGVLAAVNLGSIHPAACGWCDYPTDELLRSLDHAVIRSRFIVSEYLAWPTADPLRPYVRATGRGGSYEHPVWQAFFRGTTPSTRDLPAAEIEAQRRRRFEMVAAAADR